MKILTVSYKNFSKTFSFYIGCEEVFTLDFAEAVKSTRLCQIFYDTAVYGRTVDTLDEIVYVGKRASVIACSDNFVHNVYAYAFYCRKPVADISLFVYTECGERLVYIRALDVDMHGFALVHKYRQLCYVGKIAA